MMNRLTRRGPESLSEGNAKEHKPTPAAGLFGRRSYGEKAGATTKARSRHLISA